MKVLRSPALALAIVALCLGLPARADIAKDARAYCNTEYGGGSKNVERCVRRQLRAAESVGEQLAREAANPEAQRVYERCAAESIARVGIHDWSRTETCLINELRPYHRFMRAKEAGRDDKFIRSVIAFCRAKLRKKVVFTYRQLDSCRQRQTTAGYAVGDIYNSLGGGAPERFAIDDCMIKYQRLDGTSDWQKVQRCTDRALYKLRK